MPNPDTRELLVQAGRALADELPLERLYAGLTARAVAERAGVTTGSFFHHFPTFADFTDALALSFLEFSVEVAQDVEDMVDALDHTRFVDVMRELLRSQWELAVGSPELVRQFRLEMMLWSHHRAPLSTPTEEYRTVADVLGHTYKVREDGAAAGWYDLLEQTGLVLVEGFTTGRMSTALTGLWQGLQIRRALDPSSVDDDLFADVATLLTAAVVQGRGVAANTFRPHYREVELAVGELESKDPLGAVRAGLAELSRVSSADPEVARALLSERLAAHSRLGDELAEGDIRVEVPLVGVLLGPLESLGLTRSRAIDVASTVVNFVLAQSIPRPARTEETVELAMRLLPPEIVVPPRDRRGRAADLS